jgi:DedD protein
MSAERKKLLWISISACIFVLLVLAAGFFLLTPKKGSSQAPATIGNSAPPKAQDPQDFLSTPPPTPSLEQPRNQDGGMIIVYGDKPGPGAAAPGQNGAPGASASGATGAAGSAAAAGVPPAAAATGAPPAGAPGAFSAGGAPTTAAKAAATASKPAAQGGVGMKPAAGQKTIAAYKPAAAKVDQYWIQAGSFTSRGRADELKQAMADKGIAALISVKDIAGKSYYRVRVGPYSVKAEADDWLSRLKDIPGSAEAYVSRIAAQKAQK